jgi:hypothetical protein
MFQPDSLLMIEFDWLKGDNNLPGNTTSSIFSLGSEYYLMSYLPLRAGVSLGGPEEWTASVGSGIKYKHLVIDLAAYGINNMIAGKRLAFSISGKLVF